MRLIAEVGQAHDGSLGQAHAYIDACAQNGINEVKFQTHIADSESSDYEPFRVNFLSKTLLGKIIGGEWNLMKINGVN